MPSPVVFEVIAHMPAPDRVPDNLEQPGHNVNVMASHRGVAMTPIGIATGEPDNRSFRGIARTTEEALKGSNPRRGEGSISVTDGKIHDADDQIPEAGHFEVIPRPARF